MIKSQNTTLKLFFLFTILFLNASFSAFCDSPQENLLLADSLFAQKKYTQSFELYQQIQKKNKKSTPAMLLKMAFIKEGLGDYTNALYYLNLYYLKTYDKKALKKMELLAKEHKLSGYDYNDAVFFLNIYHKYELQIDVVVGAITILLMIFLIFQQRGHKKKHTSSLVAFATFLLLLLLLNNFWREHPKAIINQDQVYLMDGPSPAANVIDQIGMGNRVDILGKNDVWVKIDWDNKEAYVRYNNLTRVKL